MLLLESIPSRTGSTLTSQKAPATTKKIIMGESCSMSTPIDEVFNMRGTSCRRSSSEMSHFLSSARPLPPKERCSRWASSPTTQSTHNSQIKSWSRLKKHKTFSRRPPLRRSTRRLGGWKTSTKSNKAKFFSSRLLDQISKVGTPWPRSFSLVEGEAPSPSIASTRLTLPSKMQVARQFHNIKIRVSAIKTFRTTPWTIKDAR